MMPGAKQSSTSRKERRIAPDAERRLRASFPEVWAWYELISSARGATLPDPTAAIRVERASLRTSARR